MLEPAHLRTQTQDDDQASGLRRLFGAQMAQVVAFASARAAVGCTTLLASTAAALAHSGHGVVVIDENPGPANLLAALGVTAKYDLMDMVQSARTPKQVTQSASLRVRAVAAQRFAAEMNFIDIEAADRLDSGLRQIQQGAAFVLIDCAGRVGGGLSPLALSARHMAIVVAAQSEAITRAYALIKRLARERGCDGFQIVITRARNDAEATAIFQNLRRTALNHLGVRLHYLGGAQVPTTDHLAQALIGRLAEANSGDDSSGFAPFLAPRPLRKAAPGRAGQRLESVV